MRLKKYSTNIKKTSRILFQSHLYKKDFLFIRWQNLRFFYSCTASDFNATESCIQHAQIHAGIHYREMCRVQYCIQYLYNSALPSPFKLSLKNDQILTHVMRSGNNYVFFSLANVHTHQAQKIKNKIKKGKNEAMQQQIANFLKYIFISPEEVGGGGV